MSHIMTPRTAIISTLLAQTSGHLGHDEIEALLDVGLTATEEAALNTHPLLDFDEYRDVRL